jgi:hypothetical protein
LLWLGQSRLGYGVIGSTLYHDFYDFENEIMGPFFAMGLVGSYDDMRCGYVAIETFGVFGV